MGGSKIFPQISILVLMMILPFFYKCLKRYFSEERDGIFLALADPVGMDMKFRQYTILNCLKARLSVHCHWVSCINSMYVSTYVFGRIPSSSILRVHLHTIQLLPLWKSL